MSVGDLTDFTHSVTGDMVRSYHYIAITTNVDMLNLKNSKFWLIQSRILSYDVRNYGNYGFDGRV